MGNIFYPVLQYILQSHSQTQYGTQNTEGIRMRLYILLNRVVAIETKTHFVCLPSPPTSCLQVLGSKTIRHHAPWWLWAWI